MRLRRSALALAAVAGLATSALTTPATAAVPYPVKSVWVTDDSGSYIEGTVTFYNRSVGFVGTMGSVGCRRAWYSAYDAAGGELDPRSSSTHCDTTTSVPATIPADVVGGAAYVWICLDDATAVHTACQRYYPN